MLQQVAEVQQQLASSQSTASQLQEQEVKLKHSLEGQASELAAVRCSLQEESRARSDVVTELASVRSSLEEERQARSDVASELAAVRCSLEEERQARSGVVTELASVSCRLEEQRQARSDALTELQTVSISPCSIRLLPRSLLSLCCRKRKDYYFRRSFHKKPGVFPGCPNPLL